MLLLISLMVGLVEANPEKTFILPGGAEIEMVWIEPGTFMMGSPDTDDMAQDREKPQHEVTITQGFYLGRYEITQAQWESVMGTRPWEGQKLGTGEVYHREGPDYPAVYVSWNDIQILIKSLNRTEGSGVYRLPTEAEWEYACRAGTETLWSFGDDESRLGDYAWYYDNALGAGEEYAHEVGTKLPNPWGLYDMHGNVEEWCQDWYDTSYYATLSTQDPTGPSTGSARVMRGGYFGSYARYVRSAFRDGGSPGFRGSLVGARLLRTGPAPEPLTVTPDTWGQIKRAYSGP